jgi:hypothetical protein
LGSYRFPSTFPNQAEATQLKEKCESIINDGLAGLHRHTLRKSAKKHRPKPHPSAKSKQAPSRDADPELTQEKAISMTQEFLKQNIKPT